MQALRLARILFLRRANWFLLLVPFLAWSPLASAGPPKVCGNNPGLGNFDPASCPVLLDDGVGPDEVAGDGIYTVAVALSPTPLLEYKLLPSGAFDGTQLGQSGTCDLMGLPSNTFGNIQVPAPDTSRPVRFFYDSRVIADPTYSAPPANRSVGDDLMLRSPATVCPQWLAVGDFQGVPFDRTVGAVELLLQRPGVLVGRLTATKALASGWLWKVAQSGSAGQPARRYGPSGWASDPCNTDSAKVPSAVTPGDIVYFTWYSNVGRLQTVVVAPGADSADGGVHGGLPLCPPLDSPDLGATDLAAAAGDASTTGPGDAGGSPDPDSGVARPRPGIHCDCQLGGPTPKGGAKMPAGLGIGIVAAYLSSRRRRFGALNRARAKRLT